ASVIEWIGASADLGKPIFQRSFRLSGVKRPLWLVIGRRSSEAPNELKFVVTENPRDAKPGVTSATQPDGLLAVHVEPTGSEINFSATLSLVGDLGLSYGDDTLPQVRWPEAVTTKAALSTA